MKIHLEYTSDYWLVHDDLLRRYGEGLTPGSAVVNWYDIFEDYVETITTREVGGTALRDKEAYFAELAQVGGVRMEDLFLDAEEQHTDLSTVTKNRWYTPSTDKAVNRAIGKKIEKVSMLHDDTIKLEFVDGSVLVLYDDAQSCCESRFFTADETNWDYYKGAVLTKISVDYSASVEDPSLCDETHDAAFLYIYTNIGVIDITSHNCHNGWYGGIEIHAEYRELG